MDISRSQPVKASNLEWLEKYKPGSALLRGPYYYIAKRAMDISLVVLSMPIWLTLTVVVALLIKISEPDAPIFFIQPRIGKGGNSFPFYKFRTMVVNAQALEAKYAHLNELAWPDFKISNDPRVTPLGRFLRKTSLDEFPQFFNVLKGDMSLIGPRPTNFGPENYELWHTERLDVLPGISGLWQIVGRATTEFDDRLRLDIAYIERRCIMLDIEILFRTVGAVLRHEGAF